LPITLRNTIPEENYGRSLYIVGCGRYVMTEILPVFKSYNLRGICEFNFELLQSTTFNEFELKTNDFDVLLEFARHDANQKLFIIASYHSYHTEQTVKALQLSNTRVLIEKPPCISFNDFNKLHEVYDQNRIYIAYHRRFAAWNIKIKKLLAQNGSPLLVNMLIHEVNIPVYHWYFAPNQGTRISGNLCHWIDLTFFWIRQRPVRLSITRNTILGIDYSVYNILFENGTLVNYIPSDLGNGLRGVQEYITIRGKDLEINLSDHLHLRIWQNGKTNNYYKIRRDKGHVRLNKYYTKFVQTGIPSPYAKKDFILTTFTYIKFVEMWNKNIDSFEFNEDFFTEQNI
jgi:predicted dehydrogenase